MWLRLDSRYHFVNERLISDFSHFSNTAPHDKRHRPEITMVPLLDLFQNAEISIVFDNAKTHQPKPLVEEEPRRNVKRCSSEPMDLIYSSNRRRRTRRPSDSELPASRWSAEPTSPPKVNKKKVSSTMNNDPPTCVLRNVIKPVRQSSMENVFQKSQCVFPERKLPDRRHSLMPIMPVRQHSLREIVGCSSSKGGKKVDTVQLITQALEQLDALAENEDEDVNMTPRHMAHCLQTVQL